MTLIKLGWVRAPAPDRHRQWAMVNVPDTPITVLRRRPDSPLLWVSLIAGSLLLHVLLFLALRLYLLRQLRVETNPAPIAVEFTSSPNSTATVRRSSPLQVTASRSNPAIGSDRPSGNARPTQLGETTIAPSSPRFATRQPAIEPSPLRPSPASTPIRPEPRSSSSPRPVPPQPSPDRGNPATTSPVSPPNPSPDTGTEDNGASTNAPAPGPSGDQGPVTSNTPLPATQSAAMVEVLGSPYQKQDRKAQPARPKQAIRDISIPYLGRINQPIEMEVHLAIDENGKVVEVMHVEPLNSGGEQVDPNQLRSLAEKVFETWDFEPAQDGNPLKAVFSDLFIRARVTLP